MESYDCSKETDSSNLRSIFWDVIPVLVQRPGREDKIERLSTRLLFGHTRQSHSLRVVRMHLFSEKDLFLLHTLEVSEDDFQTLKSEQGILVDFTAFSDKIIQLLRRCVECFNQTSPSFQAVLSAGTAESVFKVVETNDFNQVPHINLCFRPGTDAAIKSFLAFRLTEMREQRDNLQSELNSKCSELSSTTQQHEAAVKRAEEAESKQQEAISQAERTVNDIQTSFRQERVVQREELLRAFDMEKAQLQEYHSSETEQLKLRLQQLTDQNASLMQQNSSIALELKECQRHLARMEESHLEVKNEGGKLKEALLNTSNEASELRSNLASAQSQLNASLEKVSLRDKTIAEQRQRIQEMECETIQMKNLCDKLTQSAAEHGFREQDAVDQIAKGNSIIAQFTQALQKCGEKLKRKQSIIIKQEEEILKNEKTVEETNWELGELRKQLDSCTSELEKEQASNSELKTKLSDCKQVLEGNEQMIRWLNSQVTELQMKGSTSVSRMQFQTDFRSKNGKLSDAMVTPYMRPQAQGFAR